MIANHILLVCLLVVLAIPIALLSLLGFAVVVRVLKMGMEMKRELIRRARPMPPMPAEVFKFDKGDQ